MAGERSKEIGEYGEKVISNILNLIGWAPFINNIDIECYRSTLHNKKLNKHGLDYIKFYKCPIHSDTQKTIAISAKYNKQYLANPAPKVKDNLIDLGDTMNCLKHNEKYNNKKIEGHVKHNDLMGILFQLNHSGGYRDDLISKIGQLRISPDKSYKPIFIIDNRRASFYYSVVENYKSIAESNEPIFAYPQTEFNMDSHTNLSEGRILPIEFLVSDIIPMKIDKGNDIKELLLFTNNNFSKESLNRLVSFSKSFTNGWSSTIKILFPDYRELHNFKDVSDILASIEEHSFANSITVGSYNLIDFRKLEEV